MKSSIDIPIVDKGLYIELGSNEFILKFIKAGELDKVKRYVAWLLRSLKAYGVKLVNPGGVEQWKYGKDVETLDDKVHYFDVTPRQILQTLASVNESLGLAPLDPPARQSPGYAEQLSDDPGYDADTGG
ncbi:MAG: hypothetical protein M5R38_06090 [Candidatus Methylomirabilis sp.]|nr:hypothetical protein [Candidatus Methylomirabilis sp.]